MWMSKLKKVMSILILSIAFLIAYIEPAWAQVVIEETDDSIFPSWFMPAEGDVCALVVPVEFSDYHFEEDPKAQLERILWSEGTEHVPSVSDYFQKASYGKLSLKGEVQPVVTLPEVRSTYGRNHVDWIEAVFEVLAQRGVDFSRFDQNQDGILDGLYLVWAGPAQNAQSSWWPYSDTFYWDFSISGIRLGSYSSLSYELLTAPAAFRQFTAIHETGHQLGLTDYYASATQSGTGASVMMDRNEGDEDCFSKMLLGWIHPQVVHESAWITLSSASTMPSAAVIVPESWDGNYLSEYFMAEYITPEANQRTQNISQTGAVRIWHVNAATSAWTNEITPSMYRYQNSGNGAKLLTVLDMDQQWYGSGDIISEQQTGLYTGESSGISIKIENIQDGRAQLCIMYHGKKPAEPEKSPELSEPINSVSESEGAVAEESNILESESAAGESETSQEMQTSQVQEGEDREENTEGILQNTEKKKVAAIIPVVFIIVVAAFLCYLLLSDKKKNKKKKKRKK